MTDNNYHRNWAKHEHNMHALELLVKHCRQIKQAATVSDPIVTIDRHQFDRLSRILDELAEIPG